MCVFCIAVLIFPFFRFLFVVPRTASIGEDSATHDRILELAPLSSSSYAALSSDEAHTPPNLIPHITYNNHTTSNNTTSNNTSAHTDSLGHTHTPIADLEANLPGAFANDSVQEQEDGKTSEKGSFRYSVIPSPQVEFPNQTLDDQAEP